MPSAASPTVSVIVSVHNGGDEFQRCLNSLTRATPAAPGNHHCGGWRKRRRLEVSGKFRPANPQAAELALRHHRLPNDLNPRHSSRLSVAMAYLDKNNLAVAAQACARLLDIDGEDRRGYDCLGVLLMEQGRVVDAIHTYELAVERIADDGELWRSLAAAYQKNGMTQEASVAIEKSKGIVSRKLRQPSRALPAIQ